MNGEESKSLLTIDTYDSCSLHRMGCVKVEGKWMKTNVEPRASSGKAKDTDNEGEPSEPQVPIKPKEHQIDFFSHTSRTSTIKLDPDQLKSIVEQVMASLIASGTVRHVESSSIPVTSLKLHVSSLYRLNKDVQYQITNICILISHMIQRVTDVKAEVQGFQQSQEQSIPFLPPIQTRPPSSFRQPSTSRGSLFY